MSKQRSEQASQEKSSNLLPIAIGLAVILTILTIVFGKRIQALVSDILQPSQDTSGVLPVTNTGSSQPPQETNGVSPVTNTGSPQPPQETSSVLAVLNNSGSTNAPESTFTIYTDGSGSLAYQKGANEARFSQYVNKTFTAGTLESNQLATMLTQITDVSTIPNHDCIKSASFGSTTTITYQGKTSGDLSCLTKQDPQIFLDLSHLVDTLYAHGRQ